MKIDIHGTEVNTGSPSKNKFTTCIYEILYLQLW